MRKYIFIGAVSAILFVSSIASAQTADIAALQKIIDDLRAQIVALTESQQKATAQIATLQSQLQLTRNLRSGYSGDDVKLLQQTLSTDPTLFSGQATGFFGALTKEAVRKLQERLGLEQTGEIGPQTRGQLNQLFGDISSSTIGIPPGLLRGGFAPVHATILPVGSIVAKGEVSIFPLDASSSRVVVHFGSKDDLNVSTSTVSYATHIHSGSCASSSPISIPLNDITRNKSETTIGKTIAQLFATYPLSVMVHRAGVVVGCGDLPAPRPIFKKMDINEDGKYDFEDMREIDRAEKMHREDDDRTASSTRNRERTERPELKEFEKKFNEERMRFWDTISDLIPKFERDRGEGENDQ